MSTKLKIAGYERGTMADGPGIRNVVFFQGCPHNCPDCHNPQTHTFDFPDNYTVDEVVDGLIEPDVDVTISGGDPIMQIDGLIELCQKLKEHKKNIWVYTGYTIEQLLLMPKFYKLIKYIDVIVDGKYDKNLPPAQFRGSSNQRILYFENGVLKNK